LFTDLVRYGSAAYDCRKPRGLAHSKGCHRTPVTVSDHSEALWIYALGAKEFVYTRHNVEKITISQVSLIRPLEGNTITRTSTRIWKKDSPTFSNEEVVKPI
jgi:hypothetical protein